MIIILISKGLQIHRKKSKSKSEKEIIFAPLSVTARCLSTNLMELCEIFRVIVASTELALRFMVALRTTTFLLYAIDILGANAESAHVLVHL